MADYAAAGVTDEIDDIDETTTDGDATDTIGSGESDQRTFSRRGARLILQLTRERR